MIVQMYIEVDSSFEEDVRRVWAMSFGGEGRGGVATLVGHSGGGGFGVVVPRTTIPHRVSSVQEMGKWWHRTAVIVASVGGVGVCACSLSVWTTNEQDSTGNA